jgi:hypothetical protein
MLMTMKMEGKITLKQNPQARVLLFHKPPERVVNESHGKIGIPQFSKQLSGLPVSPKPEFPFLTVAAATPR